MRIKKTFTPTSIILMAIVAGSLTSASLAAQPANDNCSNAQTIQVGAYNAAYPGTTIGATHSTPEAICAGVDDDDDVWYQFEATATAHNVFLQGQNGFNGILEVSSGTCASFTNLACANTTGSSGIEYVILTGLTVGNTYFIRIYSATNSPSAQGDFEIKVVMPNDVCTDAIELIPATGLDVRYNTTLGATASGLPAAPCAGTPDDEVWFKFTAAHPYNTVHVFMDGSFDGVVQVRSGACGSQTSVACANNGGNGDLEEITLPSLTVGQTYYIRVWSFGNGTATQGNFFICVTEFITTTPVANDECSTAISITPAGTCTSTSGTTLGASASAQPTICDGGTDDDVWYQFIATDVDHTVQMECTNFDGVLEVLSGNCGALSNLGCSDITGYGGIEEVSLTGLTIGNTYYIRMWSYATGYDQGNFNVCVTVPPMPPANNNCSAATPLIGAAVCNYTAGTTINATNSTGSFCLGDAFDDVWYTFTPTQADYTVQLNCLGSFDGVMMVGENTNNCTSIGNLNCYNATGAGGLETATLTGLQIGIPYLIQVFSFGGTGEEGNFEICLIADPVTPVNDNCGGAIVLIPGQTCNYTTGTTQLTDPTNTYTPLDCPYGNADDDVWYKFTASTPQVTVHLNCIGSFNGVMEAMQGLNGGNCTGFISAGCSNNTGGAGQVETIEMNNLVAGEIYFIHLWSFGGAGSQGDFQICVQLPPAPTNDDCANAHNLTPSANATCTATSSSNGTTVNATNSAPAGTCAGNPDDDVWYLFTATSPLHLIRMTCNSGFDGVLELRSGACGASTSIVCTNAAGSGGTEELRLNNLTVGTVYAIRIWSFGNGGSSTGTFEVCVTSPPINDDCQYATLITANNSPSCANSTNGSTAGASLSAPAPSCASGDMFADVWYKFVATSTTHIVNVTGNGVYPKASVYASCGSSAIACIGIGLNEFVSGAATGLTVGNTYYVRIYMAGLAGTFTLCVAVPQPNDECANAITLPVYTSICGASTAGSTEHTAPSSGNPATCGTADDDVWYAFVATNVSHRLKIVQNTGFDAAVEVRTGSCSGTIITCQNNNSLGIEYVNLSSLTIGSTYYIRIFSAAGQQQGQGSFTICLTAPGTPPANDNCSGATTIVPQTSGACVYTSMSTLNATASTQVLCSTTLYNDIWYQFTTNIAGNYSFSYQNLVVLEGAPTNIGMALYTGGCTNYSIVNQSCVTGYGSGGSGSRTLALSGNTTYYFRVWANEQYSFANFDFCIKFESPNVPANDECVNAINLALPVSLQSVSTINATQSADPWGCNQSFVGTDIWYQFTSPVTSTITFGYNNMVGLNGSPSGLGYVLYTGSCGNLTPYYNQCSFIAQSGIPGTGQYELYVQPNTTYYLRIWIPGGISGTFNLNLIPETPPANDACVNAESLYPFGGFWVASSNATDYATESLPTITCGGSSSDFVRDLWYKRTITTAGNYSVKIRELFTGSPARFIVDIKNGSCASNVYLNCLQHTTAFGDSIVQYFAPGDYLFRIFPYSPPFYNSGEAFLFSMSENPLTALPIELTTFTAKPLPKTNLLHWTTASETNNLGFDIERSRDGRTWQTLGFVAGHNSTSTRQDYGYEDLSPLPNLQYYRLRQWDTDGASTYSPIVSVQRTDGSSFTVSPNPSSGLIMLRWAEDLPLATPITLFNSLGQVVRTLVVAEETAIFTLDISDLPAGVYYLAGSGAWVKVERLD